MKAEAFVSDAELLKILRAGTIDRRNWPDATRAIVYLKEPAFLGPWREWRAVHGLAEGFAAETVCDVCRDEWLFEIELDAAKGGRII